MPSGRRKARIESPIDHRIAERFVRANWPALAASAWRFHLTCGPGALIVDWSVVERWSKDPAFPFQPGYATETESDDFNRVIKDYDPKTAIVIAFADGTKKDPPPAPVPAPGEPFLLRPGTALAAMTITAEPSPPEAHRARGH
jgi:hypothetical protein